MKTSSVICALAALTFGLGSFPAGAQGSGADRNEVSRPGDYSRDYRGDRGPGVENRNWGNRSNDRNDRNDRFDRDEARRGAGYPRDNGRVYDSRGYDRGYRDYNRHDGGNFYYGARSPEFRRGGYIPYEYRNRQYYVNDWRGHHLSAPPRGYQWVQVGADYVLIAIATGLIANLILNQ